MQNNKARIKTDTYSNHSFSPKDTAMPSTNLVVKCTACSCIIDYNDSTALAQHPILRVLLCSLCLKRNLEMVARKEPESGYCLWCSQKQNLVSCGSCPKSFCIECIERNLGASELATIEQQNWRCYACHSAPLEDLISFSEMMMDYGEDDEDEDSDMEGDLQKQLEQECWLDYHMDNVRHQIEDVGEHLYHLKIKLRRERALCSAKDQDATSNKFLERVEIILQELMKNVKMMIITLRTKKQKQVGKPHEAPGLKEGLAKAALGKAHDQTPKVQQHHTEKKIPVVFQQHKFAKAETTQKPSPSVSKMKTTPAVVRTTPAPITPNPCMSPPSFKLYSNILQNPEIMVRSHPSPLQQAAKPTEIHELVIKKEPLSPQHDESLHDQSPEPPKMVPVMASKMAKTKVVSARLKHSEKKTKPFENANSMSLEPIKPAGQQEAMLSMVIKQEPPDETVEEHREEDKVAEKRAHVTVKQEPPDEDDKPMDSPPYPKKFKYSDPEDSDYSASKSTKLLEELMSRKDLSIQPAQQRNSGGDIYSSAAAVATTSSSTYVQATPQKSVKQRLMEEEEEDEDHQHALFEQDTPTKLPPGIEYSQHPRGMNRQSMSAVIDLLKGDSSLGPAGYQGGLSDDEDMSDQGESGPAKEEEMMVSTIKREPLDHEEDEEFLEDSQQYGLQAGVSPPGNSELQQQHMCKECGQTFPSYKLLVHHSKQNHGAMLAGEKRPFKCTQCPYSSDKGSNLRSHMRTHTDVRPFICVFCEKSFKQASNLNKHMKLHTEEKMYLCRECQQKFPTQAKLKKHRLEGNCSAKSNSAAVNQCQYCDKTFPDVEQLNGHVLTHFVTDGSSYSTSPP